jgi:hypothetical protein
VHGALHQEAQVLRHPANPQALARGVAQGIVFVIVVIIIRFKKAPRQISGAEREFVNASKKLVHQEGQRNASTISLRTAFLWYTQDRIFQNIV